MGRNIALLTPTQEDDTLFAELTAEIRRINARKLMAYVPVSHETIYKYCRREPVSDGTEESIIEGIRLYHEARKQEGETTKESVRQVLAMAE